MRLISRFHDALCVIRRSNRETRERLARHGSRLFRPRLEALEDRIAPALILWDGGPSAIGTDWHVPANWVDDVLPGPDDDARIGADFSGVTITSSADVTIRSMTSAAALRINGGIFAIATTSAIENTLELSAGTLAGTGTLTVQGFLTWSGGTMSGLGRTVGRDGLSITGAANKTLDARTLDNALTATWTGSGNILAPNSPTMNNLAGATFEIQNNATMQRVGLSRPTFNNAGLLRKSIAVGTTTFEANSNNTGSVEVLSGTLDLTLFGGFHTGAFDVTAGATLSFGNAFVGDQHILTASSSVSGAGTVRIVGSQSFFSIAGFVTSGTYAVSGTTIIRVGRAEFLSNAIMGSLTIESLGVLMGPATVAVSNLTWLDGHMDGAGRTVVTETMLVGNGRKGLDRRLENAGLATWSAGDGEVVGQSGLFRNLPGATFLALNNQSFSVIFRNEGLFRKQGGSGATRFTNRAFDNSGTVEVASGTLQIGGGTTTGSYAVQSTALLIFGNGEFTPSSQVTGDGNVRFQGGDPFTGTFLAGTYNIGGLTQIDGEVDLISDVVTGRLIIGQSNPGANLRGFGTITVEGLTQWFSGTMSGLGRTLANGGLQITGPGGKTLDARTIDSPQGTVWTGGNIQATNGAVFNNPVGATFDIQSNAALGRLEFGAMDLAIFNNAGTLRKSLGSLTSLLTRMILHNTGSIEVEIGTLNLGTTGTSSGQFLVAAGSTLNFSGINHVLTSASRIEAAGTVGFIESSPAGATTVIDGAYSVTGPTNIAGGTARFTRDTEFPTLSLSGGVLTGIGTLTITGLLTWTGGTMLGPGRTVANGGIAVSGSSPTLNGRVLDNVATATWISGNFITNGSAVFNNLAGGTFVVQGNGRMGVFPPTSATPVFNNEGVVRRLSSAGTAMIVTAAFNNSGIVEIQTGTLIIGGGDSEGSFTIVESATLHLTAPHNMSPVSSISGAGTVRFGDFILDPGAIVAGTYNVGSTFISGNTRVRILSDATTATMSLSAGSLSGSGTVTVTGLFTWTGGSMIGPGRLIAEGGMLVSGPADKGLSGWALDNVATGTWTGGNIVAGNGAVWNNQSGSTLHLNLPSAGSFQSSGLGTPAALINAGTVRKSGPAAVTIGIPFNNLGTVRVEDGALNVTGAFPNFDISTGTLLSGAYDVTGTLQLPNADIRTNAASIILDGPASRIINQAGADAFANFGNNATTGSFAIRNGRNLTTASGLFTNAGNLAIGAASTLIVPAGNYRQTGGSTTLPSGSSQIGIIVADTVEIQAGTLSGSGTINGNVTNNGTITVGGAGTTGILYITGNYTQTASGVLNLDIGGVEPISQHDLLIAGGTSTLAGTLNITRVGGYVPNPDDVFFAVLSVGTRSGTFDIITGLTISPMLAFEPLYFDNGLFLVTVAT